MEPLKLCAKFCAFFLEEGCSFYRILKGVQDLQTQLLKIIIQTLDKDGLFFWLTWRKALGKKPKWIITSILK